MNNDDFLKAKAYLMKWGCVFDFDDDEIVKTIINKTFDGARAQLRVEFDKMIKALINKVYKIS